MSDVASFNLEIRSPFIHNCYMNTRFMKVRYHIDNTFLMLIGVILFPGIFA